MLFVAALLADQLFRLLRDLRFRRRYRVAAWVAVVGCSPILVFASQIYPEIPAALLIVVALRVMPATQRRRGRSPSEESPAPRWSGSMCVTSLWRSAYSRDSSSPPPAHDSDQAGGGSGCIAALVSSAARNWRTTLIPVVVPYAIALGSMAAAFQHWYGTASPTAPYRAYSTTNVGDAGWGFLYDYVVGDILSPVHGWIPYVPVHWLGLAGLGCLILRFGWPAVASGGSGRVRADPGERSAEYRLGASRALPDPGPSAHRDPDRVVIQYVRVSRLLSCRSSGYHSCSA